MAFLCRVLLAEYQYQDGATWFGLKPGQKPYDIHNLKDAIYWARGYMKLPPSCNHYGIDYRDFIRWCAAEIRKQIEGVKGETTKANLVQIPPEEGISQATGDV